MHEEGPDWETSEVFYALGTLLALHLSASAAHQRFTQTSMVVLPSQGKPWEPRALRFATEPDDQDCCLTEKLKFLF